jgi:tetratricopeptide (TPR) repeat protein
MRRLNTKFIVGLIILVALLVTGSYLLWTYNVSHRSYRLLEKARTAEKAGDFDKAIRFYAQYLNRKPDDVESLCEAALVASQFLQTDPGESRQAVNAVRLMSRALRSMPERNDIRRQLIDGFIELGSLSQGTDSERDFYAEARKEVVKLKSRGVEDPSLDYIHALCMDKLGEIQKSLAQVATVVGYDVQSGSFNSASASNPQMLDAYVLLANLLRKRETGGREDEILADAVIDQMILVNPESSDAFVKRGIYLRNNNNLGGVADRQRRLDEAKDNLQKGLQLDEGSIDALVENANVSILEKDYESAKSYLSKAQEVAPKDIRVYLQLAILSRFEKDPEGEIESLQSGLELLPDNHQLIGVLLTAQVIAKQTEEAGATIERMRELKFRPELIELSEAKLLCVEENWKMASNKLEALRPQMSSVFPASIVATVDHLLGRCYQRLGQPDRQLAAYARSLAANPRSHIALAGQAEALIALERMAGAVEMLDRLRSQMGVEAFESDEGLRALYLIALTSLDEKSPKYRKKLENYKKQFVSRDDISETDRVIVTVQEILKSEKIEEALDNLSAAIIEQPDAIRLQNTYLAILVGEEGSAAALEYLINATTRDENPWSDSPELFLRRAELIGLVGGLHQAERVKELEAEIPKYADSVKPKLWKKLAKMYYHLTPRQREDAKRCLQLAAKSDQDELYSLGLFELAFETENDLEMQAQIDDAAERYGKDNEVPKYLEARYLLWQYDQNSEDASVLEKINQLADQIAVNRPRWRNFLSLKGLINERQGNINGAIDFYTACLDAGGTDIVIVRHLVELLALEGRFDEARKILMRLSNIPQSLKKEQVTLDLLTGNREAALKSLNQAAPIDSNNSEDWIRRGRVLLRLKKLTAAEKAFRRAVNLAPDAPQPSLALVEYLLQMRREAEAEREIRSIENRFSENMATRAMGQSYAWLGNRLMAEHYLTAAVAEKPQDMSREQALARYHILNSRPLLAIPHLNSILENKLSADIPMDALAVWARRALARVLASIPNHRSFRQALALVEANRMNKELEAADASLKGLILATRSEPIYRKHGLSILENVARENLETESRLALAQLYFSSNRWSDCREIMQSLLVDNPTDVRLLTQYVGMLIKHEEWQQAAPWLRQLQDKAPTATETIRLSALAAKGRRQQLQAIEITESLIPEGIQAAEPDRVFSAAKIYEQLKLYTAAEKAYRALANRELRYRLELAAYLIRRGQLNESFRICNALFSKETALQISAMGLAAAVQNLHKLTLEQKRQLDQWLKLTKQEFPSSVNLVTQEAALRSAEGKFEEALKLLNSIPKKNLDDNQRGLIANNRAYMNVKLGGNTEQSLKDINTAVELLGPRIELLDTRAMIYLSLGEYEKAIADLEEATIFEVNSGIYYFHLALAYQAADNRPAAQNALEIAKEMKFLGDDVAATERGKYDKLRRWLRH